MKHRYIVVEGPIGCGKTSLANKLAERIGATTLLEDAAANPFLPQFYRDMRRQTGLLMDGDKPAGGIWNLDAENRVPPKQGLSAPPAPKAWRRSSVGAMIPPQAKTT